MAIHRIRMSSLLAGVAIVASLSLLNASALAQQAFKSPDEAATALAAAVKSGAVQEILKVLGPDGDDIVNSGDDVADADTRAKFVAAYDAKHAVKVDGKTASLIVGPNDFAFPIPLTQTAQGWTFDTAAGWVEILARRIGSNELSAIQAALAFVDAEHDYADKDRGNGIGVYAQKIVSTPGKTDGLFWPSANNDSPLGELAAKASAEGYKAGGDPEPYHGYYYRILTRQGPNAPGGAMNYIVNGKMIGGFGLIAYPAEYGNSGIMTFMVSHDGKVYQSDLGADTIARARRILSFDPDKTWKQVEPAS